MRRGEVFAYQINENCSISPGVLGWLVCIIKKSYIYDELGIFDSTSTASSIHDGINVIATQNLEVV
jgi:hypothetical protein|tara:strand:+ start:338 stop:535 length:198 start_codon:yes stop_codon:yes gene_type:complete